MYVNTVYQTYIFSYNSRAFDALMDPITNELIVNHDSFSKLICGESVLCLHNLLFFFIFTES